MLIALAIGAAFVALSVVGLLAIALFTG